MTIRTLIALAAMTVAAPAGTVGQEAPAPASDPRWTAWLGCWRQIEDSVRTDGVPAALRETGTEATRGVVVCVTPASVPSGVTFSTVVEKQSTLEETVVADGAMHAIDEPGCRGRQRATWSQNGRRLFARAELSCTDGSTRTISGLTTIGPGPTWLDIQAVTREGRDSIRVRQYRRAGDHPFLDGRLSKDQLAAAAAAAARQAVPLTIDEVKEAVRVLATSAVEAALIETDASFPLNARRLQELDAAGVPGRVIDLMIALSFPDRFIVERRAASSGAIGPWPTGAWGVDPFYDLFPYHYAPFGYAMWGRHDLYYYGAPVYAVDDAPQPQPSGRGRVVDGQGYTRVREREPQPAGVAGGANGAGMSSDGGRSGGVSTHGYSGGGGDTGRTAVSRPPGS